MRELGGKGVQWSDLNDRDSSQSLQTGCGMTLGELPALILLSLLLCEMGLKLLMNLGSDTH